MGFVKLSKTRGAGKQTKLVSIAKSAKGSQLQFSMSNDVYAELGRPDRVEIFVGDGVDVGTVLLVPTEATTGYSVHTTENAPNIHKVQVSASRLGIDRLAHIPSAPATWQITDHGLAVAMPQKPTAQPQRRMFSTLQPAA